MHRLTRLLALSLLLLGLAACSTSKPVLNPSIGLPPDHEFSQVELQQAIIAALEANKWRVGRIEPTQIRAAISVRQRHHAQIAIDYSPFDLEIRYVGSQGLDYKDGRIHRNYNRWVNNLRAEIERQLHLAQNPL